MASCKYCEFALPSDELLEHQASLGLQRLLQLRVLNVYICIPPPSACFHSLKSLILKIESVLNVLVLLMILRRYLIAKCALLLLKKVLQLMLLRWGRSKRWLCII